MSTITIKEKCIGSTCPHHISIDVNRANFKSWINGTLIQVAFPELSSSERESLLTGFCEACQDDMFESWQATMDDWITRENSMMSPDSE